MGDVFAILRSQPHGHIAAALGTARRLGLERLLDRRRSRCGFGLPLRAGLGTG